MFFTGFVKFTHT